MWTCVCECWQLIEAGLNVEPVCLLQVRYSFTWLAPLLSHNLQSKHHGLITPRWNCDTTSTAQKLDVNLTWSWCLRRYISFMFFILCFSWAAGSLLQSAAFQVSCAVIHGVSVRPVLCFSSWVLLKLVSKTTLSLALPAADSFYVLFLLHTVCCHLTIIINEIPQKITINQRKCIFYVSAAILRPSFSIFLCCWCIKSELYVYTDELCCASSFTFLTAGMCTLAWLQNH